MFFTLPDLSSLNEDAPQVYWRQAEGTIDLTGVVIQVPVISDPHYQLTDLQYLELGRQAGCLGRQAERIVWAGAFRRKRQFWTEHTVFMLELARHEESSEWTAFTPPGRIGYPMPVILSPEGKAVPSIRFPEKSAVRFYLVDCFWSRYVWSGIQPTVVVQFINGVCLAGGLEKLLYAVRFRRSRRM
ncbi:hypothetical protein A2Z33_03815 [Candidatus Gottesmanbacteria bacterium RBG_16_52_11]|uniref:Uncharacterized protein n=1 Tax=Candidatus Gottesmanbacteria bacterium RBG_16_52_11 TaxID=1798374 RepID=A0A1F5YVN1_9BACT|nr:MAG: hypothetical protein A2Z33_03815 [Candidatus Gottesmanbacteria bacterium RBG_16_52_11]